MSKNSDMLTIGELKSLISKLPDDAVVVIGGQVVTEAEIIHGRIHDPLSESGGFYNATFSETAPHKGKAQAIVFKNWVENTEGEVFKSRC